MPAQESEQLYGMEVDTALPGRQDWPAEVLVSVFFNEPLFVVADVAHSSNEERLYALGQSDEGRRLVVVFTIRANMVRVISARDMSRRERRDYERG